MLASAEERVCLDARRHGVVLARPLGQALVLAGAGAFLLVQPWPLQLPGAPANGVPSSRITYPERVTDAPVVIPGERNASGLPGGGVPRSGSDGA